MDISGIEIHVYMNYNTITARETARAEPTERERKETHHMTSAEMKARNLLASRTLDQLLLDWELTEDLPMTPELPTVRGWIMEEFRRRDEEAYEAWSEDEDLDASPRKYYR